ncbi:MAG: LysR family transcriptional regulator [Pseudomonadota bacterium]
MSNWDDYRYLLAVGEAGSFSAAARKLGVSQPTVSRRIVELERRLGVTLFERLPDGPRISSAGGRMVQHIKTLAEHAETIEMVAREGASAEMLRVKITASEGIAQALITPLIARFRDKNRDVGVDLNVTSRAADIRRSEADIAIRIGDPVDDNLIGRRVGATFFGLYGHDSYLARVGSPKTPQDLDDHSIIESTGEIAHLPQAVWLRAQANSSPISYSSNSLLNQLGALQSGMGLMTLPTYLAASLTDVRRVLNRHYNPSADVWLLSDRGRKDDPGVRRVLNMFSFELPRLLGRISEEQSAL